MTPKINRNIKIYFQVLATLDETWLSFFPVIQRRITDSNIQYRALIATVNQQHDLMKRTHESRALSSIGLVSQDMKDLQVVVNNEINNRANVIGNPEAGCILEARRDIESAADQAGDHIMTVAHDWILELHILNDEYIGHIVFELELITSLFDFEILSVLAYYNSVTEMEELVTLLYFESVIYEALFELFVSLFFDEFVLFEMITNGKNARLFPVLHTARDDFFATANRIRTSLPNCNA